MTGAPCCGWPTSAPSRYHPALGLADNIYQPTHLILDLDPPERSSDFAAVVGGGPVGAPGADRLRAGRARSRPAVRAGLHVFVPDRRSRTGDDVAAATRALAARAEALDPAIATTAFIVEDRAGKVFVDATRAGGATVAAAYSPRLRPGTPVSFPLSWSELADVRPADFTVHTALAAPR